MAMTMLSMIIFAHHHHCAHVADTVYPDAFSEASALVIASFLLQLCICMLLHVASFNLQYKESQCLHK